MATDDFFRARVDQMIDFRHPLAILAGRMPWGQMESVLAPAFARKSRAGQVMPGCDLFGMTLEIAGAGISAAGRPRLLIRLMAALPYLKLLLSTAIMGDSLRPIRVSSWLGRLDKFCRADSLLLAVIEDE